MLTRRPETYIVNRETELTDLGKLYYQVLQENWRHGGRITDLPQMLEKLCRTKFELFDTRTWNSAEFNSYLMDLQLKFQEGQDLDMSVLHDDILKVYQFTGAEKKLFIDEVVEEKIWAIFKFVIDPALKNINNK